MAQANSLNISQTGVVYFNGTATFTGTGNGTSGQVLRSQGAATPAYSTATYPSTAGTSGNVLTSDGTNWVSSAPAASGSNFSTNTSLFTDFLTNAFIEQTNYDISNATSTGAHPGQTSNSPTSAGAGVRLSSFPNKGDPGDYVLLGSGAITTTWIINPKVLSAASPRYVLYVGLHPAATAAPASGVYFQYSDNLNSGNWQIVANNAGTATTANTSTAVASNTWVKLRIDVNAAGTSANFYVNDVEVANSPIATNLPASSIGLYSAASFDATVGTVASDSVAFDLAYLSITLTTPR